MFTNISLQLLIEVEDDGGLIGDHRVSITIDRNLNTPVMTSATLNTTILENVAIGTALSPPVSGSDADSSVS